MTTPKTNRTVKPKGKSLSARLLSAQQEVLPAEKGGRNDYANYDYASEIDVIKVGKPALVNNGLFLLCLSAEYIKGDGGGTVFSMWEIHSPESDETKQIGPFSCPAPDRKGTTSSMVALAVRTSLRTLAYVDTLQIPRVGSIEIDSLPEHTAAPNVSVKKKSRIQAEKDSGAASGLYDPSQIDFILSSLEVMKPDPSDWKGRVLKWADDNSPKTAPHTEYAAIPPELAVKIINKYDVSENDT